MSASYEHHERAGLLDGEPVSDWRVAHAALTALAARKAGYDAEEARWLVAGKATGVHIGCGYGSYLEYLERTFGYSPRLARERIRVAEALVRLPQTMAALAAGALRWSAVREVTRVATAETESDWIAATTGKGLREVEEMVSGRLLGDRPADMARPEARRHVLRLELAGPTYAVFRQAIEAITREAGHTLSDDEAMQLLCHRALAGGTSAGAADAGAADAGAADAGAADAGDDLGDVASAAARDHAGVGDQQTGGARHAGRARDAGRASYQIVRGRCSDCERRWQEGGGRTIEVDEVALEVADCDAQFIGQTHVGHPDRAAQSIPPAARRLAIRRAHGRCEVPGCRHSAFVDVHHIRFRCDAGTHDVQNLAVLCSVHHGHVHAGRLIMTGRLPALRFIHADGRAYGSGSIEAPHAAADAGDGRVYIAGPVPAPQDPADAGRAGGRAGRGADSGLETADASMIADAVSAMTTAGFRQREAREAVAAAAAVLGANAGLDQLLRTALGQMAGAMRCRETGPEWPYPASACAAG